MLSTSQSHENVVQETGGVASSSYQIEQIKRDHPAIWTALLETAAVCRCRTAPGGRPRSVTLANHCQNLPRSGTGDEDVRLSWQRDTSTQADKAENTYQERVITENAAIGVCAAVFAALQEGEITEVTQHGSGVDYWVGRSPHRAILEASGTNAGNPRGLTQLHQTKVTQLTSSRLSSGLPHFPGYVYVLDFGLGEANFSYHP
jgi:hypothetical protein